jgi:hypothetical protein
MICYKRTKNERKGETGSDLADLVKLGVGSNSLFIAQNTQPGIEPNFLIEAGPGARLDILLVLEEQ